MKLGFAPWVQTEGGKKFEAAKWLTAELITTGIYFPDQQQPCLLKLDKQIERLSLSML